MITRQSARDRRRTGRRGQILSAQQMRFLSSCLPGANRQYLTSMTKTLAPRGQPIMLHLRGGVDMTDFLALADALATQQASRPRSNILFDWSDLVSWNFRTPANPEIQSWLRDADLIDRLAIVHHRRWNRQAAWFAALFRTRDCHVRSYRLDDRDRAMAWLTSGVS